MAGYSAKMDWSGPDVLKVLEHEDPGLGKIDSIVWGVTDSGAFEKAKKHATGTVLCVTGKHPDDERKDDSDDA